MNSEAWTTNNPAGRLYRALHDFKNASKQLGGAPLHHVWAHVFKLSGEDTGALFAALQDVRHVFAEYRAAVETYSSSPQWLLQDVPAITALLNARNLEGDWGQYVDSVSEGVLRTLAHASHELNNTTAEPVLSVAEVQEAREALEAAYQTIDALELDPRARASLQSALDGMQSALARYRTLGIEAFWEEWIRALKDIIAAEERAAAAVEERAAQWKPVRRALALFTKAATLFGRGADAVIKIAGAHDGLTKLLGDGTTAM